MSEHQNNGKEKLHVKDILNPKRLPCDEFEKMRRSVVLPALIRRQLTRYSRLIMTLQKTQCSDNPLNGLLIFSGPPGSGKTMTAQAIAQIMAKKHKKFFDSEIVFISLNPAALFSELLGKTSRFIVEAFEMVKFSVQRQLTILLIDEIESLAYSRVRISSSDPSDVVRASNELLRQIDLFCGAPNFLLIGTTNLSSHLDSALMDRADLVIPFQNPDVETGKVILVNAARHVQQFGISLLEEDLVSAAEDLCARPCEERPSGRLLAKLPLLSYLEGSSRNLNAGELVRIASQKIDRKEHL